jgi:hypothetical protein
MRTRTRGSPKVAFGFTPDRVDNSVGARNGGLYGALVVCIGGDLFEAVALGSSRMP